MMSILLFPFHLIWWLIGLVFGLLGFVFSLVIGCLSLVFGLILTVSIVGGVLGIPLIILGVLLVTRAVFR